MTINVSDHRMSTLPNCDKCGRFTARPVITQWCTGGNSGAHVCHETLLCQRCAAESGGVG